MTRFEIDPQRSSVEIAGTSSIHPIHARSEGLTGWFDLVESGADDAPRRVLDGEVSIPVDLLRSGNPLVDRETRRRIDAASHPEIIGEVLESEHLHESTIALTGRIAFRGEEREVGGEIVWSRDGDDVVLTGRATFDVRDWGLKLPRLGLLRVHPEVTVEILVHGSSA